MYPSYSYTRDYLLETMFNSWAYTPEAQDNKEDVEVDESVDNSGEAEHYSWDNLYLDPYADTIIIYNDADSSGCGCH